MSLQSRALLPAESWWLEDEVNESIPWPSPVVSKQSPRSKGKMATVTFSGPFSAFWWVEIITRESKLERHDHTRTKEERRGTQIASVSSKKGPLKDWKSVSQKPFIVSPTGCVRRGGYLQFLFKLVGLQEVRRERAGQGLIRLRLPHR